jgi:methylmalonyl-CoA mutase C-terminal domain/subunit
MNQQEKIIRVLLTRARIDPHDRGIRYLARKLVEAGIEVIYTRYANVEEIASTALEEDVDVVGIGFACSDPLITVKKAARLFAKKGLNDVPLIVGGIIPAEERPELIQTGVKRIYGPGSNHEDVVAFIKSAGKLGE